jgi:hypothetical protein
LQAQLRRANGCNPSHDICTLHSIQRSTLMRRISHALLPLALAIAAVACSTSDDSGNKFNASSGGSGASGSSGASGKIDLPTPSDELKGCAAQTSVADITPLRLFFVIDRSGSMCETEAARSCASATSKWQQTKEALKSFFVNPSSRNISASFISFAQVEATDCNAATYEKTEVKETALPDGANVLGNRLDNLVPDGNTPTLAALSGAVAYVKKERVQTIADGGKMAIVFASDGLPFGCNDTLAQSAAVLADAKAASGATLTTSTSLRPLLAPTTAKRFWSALRILPRSAAS